MNPSPEAIVCRHCSRARSTRGRGLCGRCHATPGVKERYPPAGVCGRRGVGNAGGGAGLPANPTTALPGTAEKLAAMAERAARGQVLFHPRDASGASRPGTLSLARLVS